MSVALEVFETGVHVSEWPVVDGVHIRRFRVLEIHGELRGGSQRCE
jgi:hypothetical protein